MILDFLKKFLRSISPKIIQKIANDIFGLIDFDEILTVKSMC